jgi:hypothetical protein
MTLPESETPDMPRAAGRALTVFALSVMSLSCLDDAPTESAAMNARLAISASVQPTAGDTLAIRIYAPPLPGAPLGTKPIDLFSKLIAVDSGQRTVAPSFDLRPCLMLRPANLTPSCDVSIQLGLLDASGLMLDSTTLNGIMVKPGGVTTIPGTVSLARGSTVRSVSVLPSASIMRVGDTLLLTATAMDSAGASRTPSPTTWRSGDSTIALVAQTGLVRSVSLGQTIISAETDGKLGTAQVDVVP